MVTLPLWVVWIAVACETACLVLALAIGYRLGYRNGRDDARVTGLALHCLREHEVVSRARFTADRPEPPETA